MNYILFAIFGMMPSLAWLFFYLHKDSHPEPKDTLFLVFLLGGFIGPIAVLVQFLAVKISGSFFSLIGLNEVIPQTASSLLINIIIFAPLSEELLKYLVVKWQVLKNAAFDEPIDAMIYLIVSALGFAAVENMLNIFLMPNVTTQLAFSQSIARFLSATLLHALASGIIGYFLALSLLNLKKRKLLFWGGFTLATLFHSFYNYLAWLTEFDRVFVLALASLLVVMAAIVGWQFRQLKKNAAICKIC